MDQYPRLARALLDTGDTADAVATFLRADYGLDDKQAKAAITLGRLLEDDRAHYQAIQPPSDRVRLLV